MEETEERGGNAVGVVSKIPDRWREAALGFAVDVAREGENFPKKALALLDKHFGFRRSIFFSHDRSVTSQRRSAAPGSYITYGIGYGPMYDYKERVYRDDIFHYARLPSHLRGRRVVFTDDILPFPEFEKTPFGQHMMAVDMYYQACLFLYEGERVVASIALLRSVDELRFDEDDRALLNYIGQLIELHYRSFSSQSGEAHLLEGFQTFFQELKMGAVLLNQEMSVVTANAAAREISRVYAEKFRGGQGSFLRSNYQSGGQLREVQTMVNEVSERLTRENGSCLELAAIGGALDVYHEPLLYMSAAGAMQTWHLLTITCKTRQLPRDVEHPYNSLTQQERKIAYHLSVGKKNEQIAQELHISIYTVRTHIANIYKKFEVSNKVDLLMSLQPYLNQDGA